MIAFTSDMSTIHAPWPTLRVRIFEAAETPNFEG
jgi:hypothetical protein